MFEVYFNDGSMFSSGYHNLNKFIEISDNKLITQMKVNIILTTQGIVKNYYSVKYILRNFEKYGLIRYYHNPNDKFKNFKFIRFIGKNSFDNNFSLLELVPPNNIIISTISINESLNKLPIVWKKGIINNKSEIKIIRN